MNACRWCGDRHGVDQLCQRAARGMTRRSFCFLFGAGITGALLPAVTPLKFTRADVARVFNVPLSALDPAPDRDFTHVNLYGGPPGGPHKLLATFPAKHIASIAMGAALGRDLYGSVVVTGLTLNGETVQNALTAQKSPQRC